MTLSGQSVGQFESLIEATFATAQAMQRHRYEAVPLDFSLGVTAVVPGDQPANEMFPLIKLLVVFEAEDRFAHTSLEGIIGTGGLKMPRAIRAVGARKSGRDLALKRLPALLAKRRFDGVGNLSFKRRLGKNEIEKGQSPIAEGWEG